MITGLDARLSARTTDSPADGWYEWQAGASGGKQPFFVTPSDGAGLAFAGLYEFWGKGGSLMTSCTIITSPSIGALAEIHDRMPLVLPRESWARWLDPRVDDPADLLAPWDEASAVHLELRPVANAVNDVRNDGAELIAPVEVRTDPQALF